MLVKYRRKSSLREGCDPFLDLGSRNGSSIEKKPIGPFVGTKGPVNYR